MTLHLVMTCCFFATAASGQVDPREPSPEERFAGAQAIFDDAMLSTQSGASDELTVRRKFYDAAQGFAALFADGIASDHICVNTGNAYHFAGDDARALLWYLRAVRLANSPEARAGLASLRRTSGVELWPSEQASIMRVLISWHHDVSRSTKQIIVLMTYPLGCLLAIVGMFVNRRTVVRRVGIMLIVIGLVFGVSDLVTALGPQEQWAVVVEQTRGYAGNAETYSVVSEELRPGQEAKLRETRAGWLRLELPSGMTCWVRLETCEEV